ILRGINTAIFTIWQIIAILPEVYQKQFRTPMPKEEFIKLANSSLPLIYAIANSHIDVLEELQKEYTLKVSKEIFKAFSPDSFHFSGDLTRGNLRLELNEEVTK